MAFDPTVSFMFFGSWVKTIENLEGIGVECAYRLFKAIAVYCMYDEEPDFSDDLVLNAIWPMLKNEANSSIARRKSQFKKDELNDNYHKIFAALQANPGLSHRGIAEMVGVSPSTVDRVCRKYPEDIWNSSAHPVSASSPADNTPAGDPVTPAGNTPSSDCNTNSFPIKYTDSFPIKYTDSFPIGYDDSYIDHYNINGNYTDTMTQGSDAHKKVYRGHFREDMARITSLRRREPDDDELPF